MPDPTPAEVAAALRLPVDHVAAYLGIPPTRSKRPLRVSHVMVAVAFLALSVACATLVAQYSQVRHEVLRLRNQTARAQGARDEAQTLAKGMVAELEKLRADVAGR